jgi:hypothetical protein
LAEELAYQPYQPVASPSTTVTPYGTNVGTDLRNTTRNIVNDVGTGTSAIINDVTRGTSNLLSTTPAPYGTTGTGTTTGMNTYRPYGTTTGYNAPDRTVRTRATPNGGMSWGWLGLLGLLGLAGMGGRNREKREHR